MKSSRMIIAPEAKAKNRAVEINEMYPDKEPETTPAHEKKLKRVVDRAKYITVSDQVAEHTFYYRNFKYPKAMELYPSDMDVMQRFVTKCYPMAKKGMLLVTEPRNHLEIDRAWAKHKVLKKAGYRHIVVESDTTLSDALEQLGEL